jgi:hypothetical protein
MVSLYLKRVRLYCLVLVLLTYFFGSYSTAQVTIPNNFYGVNHWMPFQIGNLTPGGSVDAIWTSASNEVLGLGIKMIRYGGIDPDRTFPSNTDYVNFINKCQTDGIEPIIQIPFLYNLLPYTGNNPYFGNSLYQSIQNILNPNNNFQPGNQSYKARVEALVVSLSTNYNVKYWTICNEPDQWQINLNAIGVPNPPPNPAAADIALFFTTISDWIKAKDPNAIIIGPDFASSQTWFGGLMTQLMNETSPPLGTGIMGVSPVTTKRYCDIWAYHTYPFNGSSSQTRAAVINHPAQTFLNNLSAMNSQAATLTNPNVRFGLTEFNIDHNNPPLLSGPCQAPDFVCNNIEGTGPNSFLTGQWMAEMFAHGINNDQNGPPLFSMQPWSIHESAGSAGQSDIGLLHGSFSGANTLMKRSTYIHVNLLALYFNKGQFAWATPFFGSDPLVKSFSAYGCPVNGASVMLMNQNLVSKTYAINLSVNPPAAADYMANFPNMVAFDPQQQIEPTINGTIQPQETLLFVFDYCGELQSITSYNKTINDTYGLPVVVYTTPNPSSCACD